MFQGFGPVCQGQIDPNNNNIVCKLYSLTYFFYNPFNFVLQAAKERRRQLEQQLPLYDMDEAQRSENLPAEELQNFHAYLERIKTQVAGQGMVQEIVGVPRVSMAQPLHTQQLSGSFPQVPLASIDNNGNIGYYPNSSIGNSSMYEHTPADSSPQNSDPGDPYSSVPVSPHRLQPDNRRGSLRDRFIGEMLGEQVSSSGNFRGESLATSEEYGVRPGMSQPLRGLSSNLPVDNIAANLSGLHINRNEQVR